MRLRVPLLWLAALLAAPQVTAQTSPAPRPDLHDGLRRWAVGPFAYGLYAPNGPGVFGAGLRYTYALHRNLDVDGALGLLYAYDTSNLSRPGLLAEGGLVGSGSIAGGATTRIGAFASTGFVFNEDGPAVTGYFGVEFRAGGAFGARPERGGAERWGVDLRLRTGVRLFAALDGVNVLTPAYGVELGFGFGRGGSRPIRSGSDTWRAIEQIEDAAHNAFHDLTGGRVAFAACYADIPSEAGPVRAEARGADEGRDEDIHVCPSSERAALQAPPATGCSLYLAAVPDGSDARVSLSLSDPLAGSSVGSFEAAQGVAALLVCQGKPAAPATPAASAAREASSEAGGGTSAAAGVTVRTTAAATVNVSDTAPQSVTVSATSPTDVTVTAPGTARVTVNAPAPTNVTVTAPAPAPAANRAEAATEAPRLQGSSIANDAAHRAIATRIAVPWPATVTAPPGMIQGEGTAVSANGAWLLPVANAAPPSSAAAHTFTFAANTGNRQLCVHAPAASRLSAATTASTNAPQADAYLPLRWDGDPSCFPVEPGVSSIRLWLQRPSAVLHAGQWPVVVTVRGHAPPAAH